MRSQEETEKKAPARRGRPRGSKLLTNELTETIASYIRGGMFIEVAAESAGIATRTFHDWMARGEGRSRRSSGSKYVQFARTIRTAQSQARGGAEARVYRDNPSRWLALAARTTEEANGWTQPTGVASEGGAQKHPEIQMSDEDLDDAFMRLRIADVGIGGLSTPGCPDPGCTCVHHRNYAERHPERGRGARRKVGSR